MQEIWKDVVNYENYYQVSNLGRVRAKDKLVKRIIKGVHSSYLIKQRMLSINKYPNGYSYVNFNIDGRRTTYLVHRLVLMAFNPVDNVEILEVNFKDENINNLNLSNLEWCTPKENANYGTRNFRCKINNPQLIKVVQLTNDLKLLKIYSCLADAGRSLKVDPTSIGRVCKGDRLTCSGYKWMYYEDYIKSTG